jgi:signal transduction histidine kinase/CheY-like chemotaxis protein/HPt (histidine-containing phosphotransfer) domain-containing protein
MASNRFIYYILTAFITGNLLLIFIQYNSVKNINKLIEGNEKVLNEFTVEAALRDVRKNIVTVETGIRNAVNSSDTTHIADLQQEVAAAEGNLNKLQKIDDNDSSVKYIDQLDELVHKKINFNSQVMQTFFLEGKVAADSMIKNGKEKELTDSITFVTRKIDSSRRHLLTEVTASIDKSGQNARTWGIILFIMVGCSGATLFWFIINRVKRQNHLIMQLDASEKKVKESAKVKENFMANMSHEIRTPLNAIVGFTSLLQKKNLDADAAVYVQSIQKSGDNLLTIVNDILDLSKFEAGMMRVESFPFSIRELLQSVETMFHEKAGEKNLELSVSVSDNIPVILEGDATRLTQILVNLIGNAIKFTDSGSVRIHADNKGFTGNIINLSFSITDTGMGIEKNKLPRIFDRFIQAEASITRKYGGTGLGLSIVKDLVQLQNGEITVESEPGIGSTFRFVIPYKIAAGKTVVGSPDKMNAPAVTFTSGRVMVVEDNEMNQSLMKYLLGQWKLSFTIVNSGAKAIEMLKTETFNLILMDIQMPGMDGYTTAQFIRQDLHLNTPVIAMTAHVLTGEKEKCISYGMNDYISKPIREQVLLNIITRFITSYTIHAPGEKEIAGNSSAAWSYINLQYMQEISNGNRDYEKTVTEQFIEIIPVDIAALEKALAVKDFNTIRQVAHNMKTTVSVMGLTDSLQPYLDVLEYEHADESALKSNLSIVKTICNNAITEACTFYSTL